MEVIESTLVDPRKTYVLPTLKLSLGLDNLGFTAGAGKSLLWYVMSQYFLRSESLYTGKFFDRRRRRQHAQVWISIIRLLLL